MSTPSGGGRRRTVWIVVGIAVLVAIVVTIGLLLPGRGKPSGGPSDGGQGTSAGPSGSDGGGGVDLASPTASAPPRDIAVTPETSRPAVAPSTVPPVVEGDSPELEPVAPDSAVAAPGGVTVTLAHIEAVDGQAVAPGEIGGPAVRVAVDIQNTGASPLDLEYIVVNAYTGKDRTPAGAIMQPGGKPFGGSLKPGDSAAGVYLFTVAEADREDVTITVDYGLEDPVVVFRGDLR